MFVLDCPIRFFPQQDVRRGDTNRLDYLKEDSLTAWPLTRALIENLIHVKEDTPECMCSGKISDVKQAFL